MEKPSGNYGEYTRSLLLGALLGIGLALVFSAGFFLRDLVDMPSAFAAPDPLQEEGYPLLDEVQLLVNRHYLGSQPDYAQRQYAAIRGMLSALGDRNTFFIDPPVARSESDVLAGTYGGIGVNLQRNEAGEYVLYPFPDGPAARAGIQDGDVLVSINTTALTLTEQPDAVDQLLRGEVKEGSGVEITIRRGEETLTEFILFEVINVPSVLWRVLAEDEQLGYIQIMRFTSRTPDEVRQAVNELREAGVGAFVLDLRNNSGGLLQESVEVAGIFLDGGVVLYEQTNETENVFRAEENGEMTDLPLVVLVNSGTASASELVAGAIQDRKRGILIGQRTFGKGTIQQIFPLSDSSSVHITSAEWFTPDRNAIDGVGLEPDLPMIPDTNGRDVEIGEAVRHLQEQLAAQESAS
ncbi:MAG: S41 family peptidase [Anaerolineae bacterium]